MPAIKDILVAFDYKYHYRPFSCMWPLQLPFPKTEHPMRADADDIPITVYEDEPSSLIAYALASTGYLNFLTSREAEAAKVDLIVRCCP